MGLDVYIYVDGEVLSHRDGSTGYLRKPIYADWYLPGWKGVPEEMDFLKETPNVLKLIMQDFDEDLKLEIENPVSMLQYDIPLEVQYLEYFKREYSELVDFMLLGCKLQLAGKHPKVRCSC